MSQKIAVIAIVVENPETVESLNQTLHEYSQYIIGRMGLPYREKKISLISVAVDAPEDVITKGQKKLSALEGETVSVATAKEN